MKTITINECAERLLNADNILILMHKSPDGDAIGCAYALAHALRKAGKKAMPVCSDDIPKKYDYITIRGNLDGSKYGVDIVNNIAKANPKRNMEKRS